MLVADDPNDVVEDDPFKVHLRSVRSSVDKHIKLELAKASKSKIVRAAYHMLDQLELFTDPDSTDKWNAHQCLGFLLHAHLLQQRFNEQTFAIDPASGRSASTTKASWPVSADCSQACIFTGAAGTGKTALLQACDVLTEVFFPAPEGSVIRSAPTRTAARLINGDTCHGAWCLPFGSVLGRTGRITDKTLQALQKKIKGKEELSLDEISMLATERLHHIDCRAREATGKISLLMGGLKLRLSGDFMQLPPVNAAGFSSPALDDEGCQKLETKGKSDRPGQNDDLKGERKAGLDLYRSIRNVIFLTKVVRAPNALGLISTCVRNLRITDTVWKLLEWCVIKPNDARLQQEPWISSPLRIIVQRHVQRTALANASMISLAGDESMEATVYVVAAYDRVFGAQPDTAEVIKAELQQQCTLRATGGLESILLLHAGARMLLHGKDCALLGLMNGAEVEVLSIAVSASDQMLIDHTPEHVQDASTRLVTLKHMPEYVLCRAHAATWILPPDMLPSDLPADLDLRGVFIVRPALSSKWKCELQGYKYSVQRSQLPLTSASSRIVYGAQGESFKATIADLQCPPKMDPHIFWLALYVMLTRAKSLEGLLLLRLPDRAALSAGPPASVTDEITRLQGLHAGTCQHLHAAMPQYFDGLLPQKLQDLFTSEAELQQTGHAIDWQDVDRRLDEALQDKLDPTFRLKPSSGHDALVITPTRRVRQKRSVFDSPTCAASPGDANTPKRRPQSDDAVSISSHPCSTSTPVLGNASAEPVQARSAPLGDASAEDVIVTSSSTEVPPAKRQDTRQRKSDLPEQLPTRPQSEDAVAISSQPLSTSTPVLGNAPVEPDHAQSAPLGDASADDVMVVDSDSAPSVLFASSGSSTEVPPAKRRITGQKESVGAEAEAAMSAGSTNLEPPEPGTVGLRVSSPCDWHESPSQDRSSPIDIQGHRYRVMQTNGDGACSMHALWGIPAASSTEPGRIELFGADIRVRLLQRMPQTWDHACSLHGSTMKPLLEDLVDRTWKDVFHLDSRNRDRESHKFEEALPFNVCNDIFAYRREVTEHFRDLAQLRADFNDFASLFFVEDNEADLVRPLSCVLGYVTSDDTNVLRLHHEDAACNTYEVSDSTLQILHHCGEGKTKYQALFQPLQARNSSDYRAAFFHATDDIRDKRHILNALDNFALNRDISQVNRTLVQRGCDILSKWFALQSETPTKPSTCTHEIAWETLRKVFKDPGYWLSHEELRCLAYCSSCRLVIHLSQDAGRTAVTEACLHSVNLPRQHPTTHVMLRLGGTGSKRGHFVRLVDEREWQSLQSQKCD